MDRQCPTLLLPSCVCLMEIKPEFLSISNACLSKCVSALYFIAFSTVCLDVQMPSVYFVSGKAMKSFCNMFEEVRLSLFVT